MRLIRIALPVLLTALAASPVAAASDDGLRAKLLAQTQELYDAVSNGDAKVWETYLAPGCTYVDEAGGITSREDTIRQIAPLPKGISGKIEVEFLAFERHGDIVSTVHREHETENYFGQIIHASYLTTTVWQKTPAGWKAVAVQALAERQDPPAIELSSAQLDAYAGTYRLKDGSLTYAIAHDGTKLMGSRDGRPAVEIFAEAPDVFFVKGQPRSRKIFRRDASGRVTGFVDRREERDLVWIRM